jgi:hypothetical protein
LRLFGAFFCLFMPNSKMKNDNHFAKNFEWCLVPLCKMINQILNFFGMEGELNTP